MTVRISAAAARPRGLKRFYTGKPCPNGHDSERYVSSEQCVQCVADYDRKKAARKAKQKAAKLRTAPAVRDDLTPVEPHPVTLLEPFVQPEIEPPPELTERQKRDAAVNRQMREAIAATQERLDAEAERYHALRDHGQYDGEMLGDLLREMKQ